MLFKLSWLTGNWCTCRQLFWTTINFRFIQFEGFVSSAGMDRKISALQDWDKKGLYSRLCDAFSSHERMWSDRLWTKEHVLWSFKTNLTTMAMIFTTKWNFLSAFVILKLHIVLVVRVCVGNFCYNCQRRDKQTKYLMLKFPTH